MKLDRNCVINCSCVGTVIKKNTLFKRCDKVRNIYYKKKSYKTSVYIYLIIDLAFSFAHTCTSYDRSTCMYVRHYMARILPIRRKTQDDQSIMYRYRYICQNIRIVRYHYRYICQVYMSEHTYCTLSFAAYNMTLNVNLLFFLKLLHRFFSVLLEFHKRCIDARQCIKKKLYL